MRKAPTFLCVTCLLLALAACQLLLPARTVSEMENRVLSQAPSFSPAAFANSSWTEGLEAFAADQLPLRDGFVSLYTSLEALTGRRLIGGVLLGREGRLFDQTDGWREDYVRHNAAALRELSALTGTPVYLLAVPSAAAVLPGDLPAGAPVANEDALLRAAAEEAPLIPLLGALRASPDPEALYYRTDHHWTAAGARIGYQAVCRVLGLEAADDAPLLSSDGFFGSFFARCPLPWVRGDTFRYPDVAGVRLIANGEEKAGLIDPDKLLQRDQYAALLYGNHPYLELLNPSAPAGTLFVIKDSYANALLPALSQHYSRIVAVDARYFTGDVKDAVQSSKGEAILCVYGLSTLATGRTIALLNGL